MIYRVDLRQLQDKAGQFFDKGYNCTQSVFHACKELFPELADVDESTFAGFGGGFAGTGRVCGAISGATAVLSAIKINKDNPIDRSELYTILNSLYNDFESKYRSLDCRDIIGIDFTIPAERETFRPGKYEQVCKPLVSFVIERIYALSG